MKVKIARDEIPAYVLSNDILDLDIECEISSDTLKRWKRTSKMFDKMQTEMKMFYNEAIRIANCNKFQDHRKFVDNKGKRRSIPCPRS